jgi:hypothetical protein
MRLFILLRIRIVALIKYVVNKYALSHISFIFFFLILVALDILRKTDLIVILLVTLTSSFSKSILIFLDQILNAFQKELIIKSRLFSR